MITKKSWLSYTGYSQHPLTNVKQRRENKVITEFREMLENNPIERMYVTQMIEQVPKSPKYKYRIKNVEHLLSLLNEVLHVAPTYNKTLLVGTPFSAIILWTMGTPAGFAAYRNEKINNMFKKILNEWAKFLNSKESLYVLNTSKNGWMSPDAMNILKMDSYCYDPNKKYWGFKSWNDFFTRKLKPNARPIMGIDNNKVIVSACDSSIYRIKSNVKKYSKFWIKSQPYSVADMLNNDTPYVNKFVGGHVFQAFLSPFNYHRWHSPISGTVLKAYVKEGLYFSQSTVFGENKTDQDLSEGYITQVQTRAIIYIKSNNPNIGIVAVMPVGMVEISSCIIHKKIKKGYKIKKGEELGYFQFGGSTHCLFFEKKAIKKFTVKRGTIRMGQQIAISN